MNWLKSIGMIWGLTVLALPAIAADWPHWRGPDYDGISKETGINTAALNNPEIVWQAEVGTGFSTISVANGKAYTAGNINKNTDVIYCFNATTGKPIWTYQYPEPLTPNMYEGGCSATPTVRDGKVYTISKTGKLFCLDADTGSEIWKNKLPYEKEPQWGFAGSPVIIDDLVIYNAGDAGIAYNKDTGKIVWQSADDVSGYASAVPFERDGDVYVAIVGEDMLNIVSVSTGQVAMNFKWKTSWNVNAADPIISGDEIFLTSGYGHGAALVKITPEGLKQVWQNKNMRSQMSGPVLINGYLYGIDDTRLACVEWKTGERMWIEKAPKKGSVSAVGDKLIVLGEQGKLSIAQSSPQEYKELSSAQVLSNKCWTMPILANGYIYVRNTVKNGMDKVICIDVRE